jgi:site-specific DNA-cytosine methylase
MAKQFKARHAAAAAAAAAEEAGEAAKGLVVLSFFDGLGAGAVALQKLGLLNKRYLERYVAVEINKACNGVVERYFIQQGLIDQLEHRTEGWDITDQESFFSTKESLVAWIRETEITPERVLVLAGSPCNNIAGTNNQQPGCNPQGQSNLKGSKSKLFYDYTTILANLKAAFEQVAAEAAPN